MDEIYDLEKGYKCKKIKESFPPQQQYGQPGIERLMDPKPVFDRDSYKGSGKLNGKVAIVTGGDSGIGRAVSVAYAKEGATVVISYYDENQDAKDTMSYIEKLGGKCMLVSGDLRERKHCDDLVKKTINKFGKIDILVNNAGVQFYKEKLEDISDEQFDLTMKTNIYSIFYLTRAALPHLKSGASIINTTSIVAFEGEPNLIDYVATKGAIVGFTRALAKNLAAKNIRVNQVAPGYVWTPLQPATGWPMEKIVTFGSDAPMGRAGQPVELAPAYVYLASEDSSYVTGETIHVNGGMHMG